MPGEVVRIALEGFDDLRRILETASAVASLCAVAPVVRGPLPAVDPLEETTEPRIPRRPYSDEFPPDPWLPDRRTGRDRRRPVVDVRVRHEMRPPDPTAPDLDDSIDPEPRSGKYPTTH